MDFNIESFIAFFNEDAVPEWEGCNALQGLKIIEKLVPGSGIESASHEAIYSVSIEKLIEAKISIKQATELKKLNWIIDDGECMMCFV